MLHLMDPKLGRLNIDACSDRSGVRLDILWMLVLIGPEPGQLNMDAVRDQSKVRLDKVTQNIYIYKDVYIYIYLYK